MSQPHALNWGALPFAGPVAPATAYQIDVMAAGTNYGNPEPVFEIIRSLLTDGSIAVLEGWDNRTAPIRLRLSAPRGVAGPALAAAEAALMAEILAPSKSPLVWVPPAKDAATTVFDVVSATLARDTSDGWDQDEEMREYRYYLLTLTCLPFVRGEETVVVPALAPPPTPGTPPVVVNIDTCDAFTGWSANFTATLNSGRASDATGGYVFARATKSAGGTNIVRLVRDGAVAMGATPFLQVDAYWSAPGGAGGGLTALINGQSYEPVSSLGLAPNTARYFFLPPANFSQVTFVSGDDSNAGGVRELRILNVARADGTGAVGSTTRQQARTALVGGSAPTQAAIRLFDATAAPLGTEIMVHTSTNTNWQPMLRRWLVSAGAVADTARVSGGRNTLGTAWVTRFPASFLTKGTYALLGLMNITTGGTLNWSARTVSSSGATTLGSSITYSGSVTLPATPGGQYQLQRLGNLPLPVLDVEADQLIELTLTGTSNMTIDEGYLCGLHDGALTWVRDADSLTWIEIRSPELGAPRPSVFGGTGALGEAATCIDWKCESFGPHRFMPGLIQATTITTTSLVSQSELEFYERDHSHRQSAAA